MHILTYIRFVPFLHHLAVYFQCWAHYCNTNIRSRLMGISAPFLYERFFWKRVTIKSVYIFHISYIYIKGMVWSNSFKIQIFLRKKSRQKVKKSASPIRLFIINKKNTNIPTEKKLQFYFLYKFFVSFKFYFENLIF